ncbi:MAG: GDP-mannose 4,6-dehydratase [Oligoflexia bacterium]|nr:GDP-mannose 4,6-dehydratase [Oligoflexia bacterium]
MNILITGGAGFIGSHLAEYLLKMGEHVQVIDDLSTGSFENISHLKLNRNFSYRIASIENEELLAEMVDVADVIIHLAAAVGVRLIVESPVRTIETNISGTEAVLRAAAKKKKLVFVASTSEVYGKRTNVPFHEDDDLVLGPTSRGRWSYACSKAIDEFLALAYWREKKLPTIVARFFNTVGPRQTGRYGMVVPTFVRQALNNETITVFGDGKQSRCFCHVADVIDAVWKLVKNPQSVGQVFNIGSTEEVTILELANKAKDSVKSRSDIRLIPYDQAYEEGFEDMSRRVPALGKITNLIGYSPRRDLDDILHDVISYERNRAQAQSAGQNRPADATV